jgi:hypothetical protein
MGHECLLVFNIIEDLAALNFQSKDQTCLAIDGREDSNINIDHQFWQNGM